MGNIRIDPKKQFSKRLARWTAWFWFLYMVWLSVIMLLQPDSAMYTVYMGIIATLVMIINVYSYCKNSIAEKVLFAILDKTQLELSLGNGNKKNNDSSSDEPDSEGEEDEGG